MDEILSKSIVPANFAASSAAKASLVISRPAVARSIARRVASRFAQNFSSIACTSPGPVRAGETYRLA